MNQQAGSSSSHTRPKRLAENKDEFHFNELSVIIYEPSYAFATEVKKLNSKFEELYLASSKMKNN